MSGALELQPLEPISLEDKKERYFFEITVKSYTASYFNLADVPLLEIYAKTLKELDTLYASLELAGNISDSGNKQYEKISRLIDTKVKGITKLGAALRISPQQRRAAGTTRQDNPEDVGRTIKPSERDAITHGEVWENEKKPAENN